MRGKPGWGRGGARQGESKKSKPIPAPLCGAKLKSCPIPAPSLLRNGKNQRGTKRGGAGKNCHPYTRILPHLECHVIKSEDFKKKKKLLLLLYKS